MKTLELKISNPIKQIAKPIEMKTSRFTEEQKERLANASIQFESLLTERMLKSMTKTTEGGLLGKDSGGLGTDIFSSIFENKLAEYMSKNQSLGIANELYQKLTGEKLDLQKLKLKKIKYEDYFNADGSDEVNKIIPSNSALTRLRKYEPYINKISAEHGVSDSLIKSIILAESSAKTDAVSRTNAKGLMQLMDVTAKDLGVENPFDPMQNIWGGTKYISELLKEFKGKIDSALAAYNAGPAKVKKYGGIPPYKETQNYVKRVKAYLKYFEGE